MLRMMLPGRQVDRATSDGALTTLKIIPDWVYLNQNKSKNLELSEAT